MFSNLLNATCTILQLDVTQSATGQLTNSWSNLYSNVACRRSEVPKNFKTTDDTYKVTEESFIFFIDPSYDGLVTHKNRITFAGKEYAIDKVSTFDGASEAHHVEVYAHIISLEGSSGLQTGFPIDTSLFVPKTTEINGHPLTSDINLTKSDIGLGNVDNTSDANKPISTAQQTALDAKQNISNNYDDRTFVLSFSNQSFINVPHNLGKYPSVNVYDTDGVEVIGGVVDHADTNSLTVEFGSPFSGQVVCN